MNKSTITILGAFSHIARGLIFNFSRSVKSHLHLYSTSTSQTYRFVKDVCKLSEDFFTIHGGYDDFATQHHDVIINCIGVGTQKKLCGDFTKYFTVGEKFDNLVIEYLQNRSPESLYVSLSSGAVYGRSFAGPVTEWTENHIKVNQVAQEDYYSICKLNSEAKHRAFSHLRIVDLRLFSYFSRFIDLSEGYFITDVIDSIKKDKVLVTDPANIVRDYVHPDDLFAAILACMHAGSLNDAFDVMSSKPVDKLELLRYFENCYGLRYRVDSSLSVQSPTGSKNIYYSEFPKISALGYHPSHSSLDTVIQESRYLLT
jgi:nucleoside-diphosphate-sugar epimerase